MYSRINSTKSQASNAGNVSEPRLTSQAGRMRELVCAYISVFLHSERWRCQYWSAYVAAAATWLRKEGREVCETRAEGCHAKWRGLCGYSPRITVRTLSRRTLPVIRLRWWYLCVLKEIRWMIPKHGHLIIQLCFLGVTLLCTPSTFHTIGVTRQKQYKDFSTLILYINFNLLNPTGHVMHQQFNIQQLYVLPTPYLCVLYLSENK